MKFVKVLAALASSAVLLFTGVAACSRELSAIDQAKAAGMTNEQVLACDDLQRRATTTDPADAGARIETARTVNAWAPKAGQRLSTAGNRLTYAANSGNAGTWTAAVDNFAHECLSMGWPEK